MKMDVCLVIKRQTLFLLLCLLSLALNIEAIGEVIWAVNCGGEAHTDIHGIKYQKDTLNIGTDSDYGRSLMIQRVVPQDQILYQTERYHLTNFGYDIPLRQDGDYVLVLKFSEVWFTAPNQKVFDVQLNGEHIVVESLDIFAKVGRGVAHDEVIPFTLKNNRLRVGDETSDYKGGSLLVEFLKGDRDNPKVNAVYLMRGRIEDVPLLPPLPGLNQREEEEEEEDLEEEIRSDNRKKRPSSGPKIQDPYAADDTGSMMLPVVLSIGAFIPLLFCLCKL